MKIAIGTLAGELDAAISERFARAPWFLIIEDGKVIEALEGTAVSVGHGASGVAIQLLADHGVQAVVARQLGPKAAAAIKAAGIEAWAAPEGTARKAVEALAEGGLSRLPL